MKILIIGDPHIKNDNEEQTSLMTVRICEQISLLKPDIIVILGDTLHKHGHIDLFPFYRAEKFIRSIYTHKDADSHLYILIGNHDRYNNTVFLTDEHAFNSFKLWPNTHVIDKVTKIKYKSFTSLCVPYVPTGRFAEALSTEGFYKEKQYHLNDVNIVFSHQEYKGAKMNSITSNNGDDYPLNLPLNVSGHIHDYDDLAANLFYPGTPIQHGFSDTTDKTISFLQFDDDNHLIKKERISLNIMKKLNFNLSPEELLSFIPPNNSQIKIKVKGNPQVLKHVMTSSHVKDLIAHGIKIIPIEIDEILVNIAPPITKMTFRQRLHEAIKLENVEIQNTFNKLFS